MNDVDHWSEEDSSSDDNDLYDDTPQIRPQKATIPTVLQAGFDSYFLHQGKVAKTSPAVFSSQVEPLSAEEYADAIKSASEKYNLTYRASSAIQESLAHQFRRFLLELEQGFNLLFYGYGSKRALLNRFAVEVCSKRGHVVVLNGCQPKASIKDLLTAIEAIPAVQKFAGSAEAATGNSNESQLARIRACFASSDVKPLFLLIHNIDSPNLRSPKVKSQLAALASHTRIHLIASIDHVNAPLLWTSTECSTRKRENTDEESLSYHVPGFSWLWHDLTTMASYDFELAHADRSSYAGASMNSRTGRGGPASLTAGNMVMSESAAQHILASVTQKAKKMFKLMATKQLEVMEEDGEGKTQDDFERYGISYDTLFTSVRDNFIATNDTAMRTLLGEFRDHNLIVGAGTGGAEILWVPMRRERLNKIVKGLDVE
ncbi:origin recognition complex, subunit 2 [Thelephora terrestris]|uniref:Origin recognition complex subunit 2 n=1 Tax=Thelephora terrestris TaxID=56493 RepID=A0A9P6L1Y6_9AGAM|nr:origin recognition complex, subunit 2 [Thelephora terrestris]